MNAGNLRQVERKVLGALLLLCDDNMFVEATHQEIAEAMGYKSQGGAITFAIQALDMKNFISSDKGQYKVLL